MKSAEKKTNQGRGVGTISLMASVSVFFREGMTERTFSERQEGGKGALQEAVISEAVWEKGFQRKSQCQCPEASRGPGSLRKI